MNAKILNKLNFRSKLLLFTFLNVLCVWTIAFVTINYVSKKLLLKQFINHGESIARSVAININEYLLTDDYNSLSLQLSNLLQNDEIVYVVVNDPNGNIILSNFHNRFPVELLQLIRSLPLNRPEHILVNTENGKAYHFSQPVLDGKIGQLHIAFSLRNIDRSMAKLNTYIFIAGLLMLLTGSALSFLYATYLANPFTRIINAANEIRKGNLEIQMKYHGNDEIATLTSAFNMMVAGIKENIRMLEESYRRNLREEKTSIVRKLIQGIAEEINNPLTGIKHLTEIIKYSENLNNEKMKEYVYNIEEGLNRINMVIQELIKYTGEFTPSIQTWQLKDLISRVWGLATEGDDNYKCRFNFMSPDLLISGNGTYLTYAFVNIIKYMIKDNYTDFNLLSFKRGNSIVVELSGKKPAIGNGTDNANIDDSTLQMNISCRIIEMHGGSVEIQNLPSQKKIVINLPIPEGTL